MSGRVLSRLLVPHYLLLYSSVELHNSCIFIARGARLKFVLVKERLSPLRICLYNWYDVWCLAPLKNQELQKIKGKIVEILQFFKEDTRVRGECFCRLFPRMEIREEGIGGEHGNKPAKTGQNGGTIGLRKI